MHCSAAYLCASSTWCPQSTSWGFPISTLYEGLILTIHGYTTAFDIKNILSMDPAVLVKHNEKCREGHKGFPLHGVSGDLPRMAVHKEFLRITPVSSTAHGLHYWPLHNPMVSIKLRVPHSTVLIPATT